MLEEREEPDEEEDAEADGRDESLDEDSEDREDGEDGRDESLDTDEDEEVSNLTAQNTHTYTHNPLSLWLLPRSLCLAHPGARPR